MQEVTDLITIATAAQLLFNACCFVVLITTTNGLEHRLKLISKRLNNKEDTCE